MAQATETVPTRLQPAKSASAFRTISEVSQELNVPQHVLRFWETRFHQIKPLKRGGGRRYYRPEDLDLLRLIRRLLYTDGYTIRGVQRLLRQNGARALVEARVAEAEAPSDKATESAAEVSEAAQADSVSRIEKAAARLDAETRAELRAILGELAELREMLGKFHRRG